MLRPLKHSGFRPMPGSQGFGTAVDRAQLVLPGLWFRCWSARVGFDCRVRAALLCPGPSLALRAVPTFEPPLHATGRLLVVRALRPSGPRAGPGRPCSAASSTRTHQPSAVASAPRVMTWLGRSTSTAPPAGTSFRQGGVALLCCGCVGGGGVRLGALSLPGTLRADQEPDGDASGGGYRCAGVEFRRLHPHQNPGAGDLPGKDRAPNLGPGLCACARPEYRVPLALAGPVEFHPEPLRRTIYKINEPVITRVPRHHITSREPIGHTNR